MILTRLFEMQDLGYRAFQANLTPTLTIEDFIGVRTPQLRAFSKELCKATDEEIIRERDEFLRNVPHIYFDENQIHVFIISEIKDFDKSIEAVEHFLPYVDNWATCDQLRPKSFKKSRDKLLKYIDKWLKDSHTYTIRFGIEMLMSEYLDEDFDESYMAKVADIRSDEYYVNMMTAWYFATALAKKWDVAIEYIKAQKMDKWTHNKAIQKAIESYRITDEQKAYLRTLKIK